MLLRSYDAREMGKRKTERINQPAFRGPAKSSRHYKVSLFLFGWVLPAVTSYTAAWAGVSALTVFSQGRCISNKQVVDASHQSKASLDIVQSI